MVNHRIDPKFFENSVKQTLDPLLMNGKILHSKIINALEESGGTLYLTDSEKKELYHWDDSQLVELVLGWVGVGIMIIDFTNCYYGTWKFSIKKS